MIYVFTFVYCAKIVSERNFQKMIVDWLDATMLFARSAGVGSICFNNFLLAMDSTTHLSLDLCLIARRAHECSGMSKYFHHLNGHL